LHYHQLSFVNVWSLNETLQSVVIFARYQYGPVVYFGIDFSTIQERKCVSDDYETWSPTDGTKVGNCVLGHDTVYLRRKRTSSCYNDESIMNHVVSKTNCNCTEDSYECDFNFERTTISNVCVRIANTPIVCDANGNYWQTQGYRKVPGDTCINDLPSKVPVSRHCGPNFSGQTPPDYVSGVDEGLGTVAKVFIALGVIFVVLGILVVGIVIGAKSERVRNLFPFLKKMPFQSSGYDTQLPMEE